MTRRTAIATLAATAAAAPRRLLAQSGPSFSVDVRVVEVYATVFDEHGRYIDGLVQETFEIRDEGRPQPIVAFGGTSDPLACAILLDTTGSMEKVLPQVRSSILDFIDEIGPRESIAIYTFDTGLRLKQDFTADKLAARRAVMRTRAGGETALFDALAQTAHEIAPRKGKKAIVVFTDGQDNASALNASAAENSLRKIGVPVYTIALGGALADRELVKQLASVAKSTGGASFAIQTPSEIRAVFESVAQDLMHGYLLAFQPPPGDDHGWRALEVLLRSPSGRKVRAREGYYPD